MKNVILIAVLFSAMFCFKSLADTVSGPVAVSAPSAAPVAAVSAPAPTASGLITVVILGVALLNIVLTAVQKIFAALGKGEPGVLTTMAKVVLSIATWLAANPELSKSAPTTPPTA